MVKLAARTDAIRPSSTLAFTARAAQLRAEGHDVISFSVGEPDFETPEHVKEAGRNAITAGHTRYTAVDGTSELKTAVVDRFLRDHGVLFRPPEVMITVGGKGALAEGLLAVVNPGDEVVIPAPYWVSYPDMVRLAGGVPVFVPTSEADGFRVHPDALRRAFSSRTRAVIINSPSNPSGTAYTRDELIPIVDEILHTDAWIISDEMYDRIVFDGFRPTSIAALGAEVRARTLVTHAVSKTYAMTGWRLGYALGPQPLISAMTCLQGALASSAPTVSQKAAVAALRGPDDVVDAMVRTFDERRRAMVAGLRAIPGVSAPMPRGAFYVLANFGHVLGRTVDGVPIASDDDLARVLLNRAGLAIVPGSAFGAPGYLRFSFATSLQDIERGLKRLQTFLGEKLG